MAAMKSKHAFGGLERVDENIKSGVIDSYDVLFVKDSEGKPYVGWVSKDGKKEIVDPYAEVSKLETKVDTKLASKANADEVESAIATKADAEEVETKLSTKADSSDVEALEEQVATKVTTEEVKMMIKESEDSFVEIVEF